jgi:hypothetical protein
MPPSGSKSSRGGPGRQDATRTQRRRAAVDRRRAEAKRLADLAARRRRRRNVRIGVVALLVVLVLGSIGVFVVTRGSSSSSAMSPQLTSDLVSANGSVLDVTAPGAYTVTYRVDSPASANGPANTSTEQIAVQRPFNGKVNGKDGAPPGNTLEFEDISNLGLISDRSQDGTVQVTQTAPRVAIGDMRLDASLSELVAAGDLVPRERRRALGRECQVYRTGQPLETLTIAKPTSTDYADACVDASGLLLEEVVVASGKVTTHVTATAVDDASTAPDSTFTITGTPVDLSAGGSQLTPIATDKAPVAGYWVLGTPPAGYTLANRYLLKEPADNSQTDPNATTTTTVTPTTKDSYVDVWVNGKDTITVQQGVTASEPSNEAQSGTDITLGTVGAAKIAPTLTGSVVLAHPSAPSGWFVMVSGTMSTEALQGVASSLHA